MSDIATHTRAPGAATSPGSASGPSPGRGRRRLGELLVGAGLITQAQLEEALAAARQAGRRERLGQALVRLGHVTETDVARCLADQLGLAYLAVEVLPVDEALGATVPAALAERHGLVPLRREADGTLVIACADPTNVLAVDDVRLVTGARRVTLAVANASAVEQALRRLYGFDQRAGELIDAIDTTGAGDAGEAEEELSVGDAPVIRLAEGILTAAVQARASDVHVEPGRDDTAVRYRIDGVLSQVMTVPRGVSGPLLSRLKLMAGMDIAERRRPQDGRTRRRTAAGDVDLRVSSLPSLYGETLVVRLLRKGAERLGIADVGLGPEELATVLPLVERPQGLVLLTGPTGSGKTSSLYAFLGHLAGESSKIITIEDPVEYELPGDSQTQVNERIGLTFSRALRTVLRQDPDVVMVGEIRDPETAELALQASLTGHLVFSTLHTNDAAGAIVRLRDLGIPAYLIASSLSLVIAQRLVRRVCVHCATTADVSKRQASLLHLPSSGASKDGGGFRTGSGCGHCGETGYRGRSGLFEILSVDERVRELIGANAAESAIRHAGRVAGMQSLREDGLAKARRGETTLDEVLRVTPGDVVTAGACPACGPRVEEDYAVCPWCAADQRPDACAQCRRSLERAWRVCPSCATPTPSGSAA